jgi:hypothetical protein
MVQEADVRREALRDVAQKERQLREYISVARVAHDATNEEAGKTKAVAAVTQVDFTGKLDFTFFWFYLI